MSIELIGVVVSLVLGIISIFLSLFSLYFTRVNLAKEILGERSSIETMNIRKYLYNFKGNEKEKLKDEKFKDYSAYVISTYELYALLVKHHYLPKWVFKNQTGISMVTMYECIECYILERKKDSPRYAENFVNLIEELKKDL